MINDLFQSLHRAIKAEEKQGRINTGAVGTFSGYLLDVFSASSTFFPEEILAELHRIAEDYSQASPYQRRGLLVVLKELIQKAEDKAAEENIKSESLRESPRGNLRENNPEEQNEKDMRSRQKASVSQSLQYIKGVGPFRAEQFAGIGILTTEDLLNYFPRRYEVRIRRRIEDIKDGELATICGKVTGSQVTKGRIKVVKLNIEQEGRSIHAIWFNQDYIAKQYPLGTKVSVTGKVQWNKRIPELLVTEIVKGEAEDGRLEMLVPVYSETARLNSKLIRSIVKIILPQTKELFPEYLTDAEGFMERSQAYREIHFPSDQDSLEKARARLVIEEILFLQLALARLRSPQKADPGPVLNSGGELVKKLISHLPFVLTNAQNRVIKEIFKDLAEGTKAMTRLVQGDVGSGKTAVAMAAIIQAVGSGFQAAMMAPTEVLAVQHYESLRDAFQPLGVEVVFLVGSQGKAERENVLAQIQSGEARVIVGTHALIQETVRFHSLGLVVTDEQHRFGVRQRTLLQDKGENPHVLVMTATPIPRTLALTLYGDLQLSVLNEMPAGRKPVITRKLTERNRPNLEKFLEHQIAAGRQIFVVCPLVEETEKSDLVSATQTAEKLRIRYPGNKVALLHGRMKGQEKDEIMGSFRRGEIDILVATTVVEVGVNIPNASVMVIEEAQRFGLAQLHQLRGRVGRGPYQAYCFVVSDVKDSARLHILCETEDGFRIAEEDLKIRGPGELLGLRQHGLPELKLTDLTRDGILVEEAFRVLQKALADPSRYARLYLEADRVYPQEKVGVN